MSRESSNNQKSKSPKKIIFLILTLLIFLTGISIFLLNIGGLKTQAVKFLSGLPVIGKIINAENIAQNSDERDILNKLKLDLERKESDLINKEKELQDREKELNKKEQEVNAMKQQLDIKVKEINDLVKYYEKMNPVNAVKVMDNIKDINLVVQILKNMNQDKATKILENMAPDKAARITEIMYNGD